jgi:uracil-DNA glycosylase
VLGRRAVRLYPIFHPAAALYTPRMLQTLREDFTRLPELLAQGAPEQPLLEEVPELVEEAAHIPPERTAAGGPGSSTAGADEVEADQLGLF